MYKDKIHNADFTKKLIGIFMTLFDIMAGEIYSIMSNKSTLASAEIWNSIKFAKVIEF